MIYMCIRLQRCTVNIYCIYTCVCVGIIHRVLQRAALLTLARTYIFKRGVCVCVSVCGGGEGGRVMIVKVKRGEGESRGI